MSTTHQEIPNPKKTELAIAVAKGMTVAAWARQNDVAGSTAHDRTKEPGFRLVVQSWRREALDWAIGMMASRSTGAVKVIAGLADLAESESVRLRAARAVLSDQIPIAKFSDLESRMGQLEAHVEATTGLKTPGSRRGGLEGQVSL
jgi:hypothetical protein